MLPHSISHSHVRHRASSYWYRQEVLTCFPERLGTLSISLLSIGVMMAATAGAQVGNTHYVAKLVVHDGVLAVAAQTYSNDPGLDATAFGVVSLHARLGGAMGPGDWTPNSIWQQVDLNEG